MMKYHFLRIGSVTVVAWLVAALAFGHDPVSMILTLVFVLAISVPSYLLGLGAVRTRDTVDQLKR
jgi:hypothetical protein